MILRKPNSPKKAGYDKLSIQFHAADTGFSGSVDAGSLMADSARSAGLDIEVVREPNDGYWSNVWMKKAFSACYWSGRPTENWIFSQIYAADASWNDTFWKNDRFNELLVQARSELMPHFVASNMLKCSRSSTTTAASVCLCSRVM